MDQPNVKGDNDISVQSHPFREWGLPSLTTLYKITHTYTHTYPPL